MNKILLFLICLLAIEVAFSQSTPNVIPRSSDANTMRDGRLYTKYNFGLPRYADTIAANNVVALGSDSAGTIISTYDDRIWKRRNNPKRWEEISTSALSRGNPDSLGSHPASYYLVRSNMTGTQAANTITGLATVATSGSYTDLTSKPTLSTVAGTGSYTDLTNKPTIPAQFSPIAGSNMTITGSYPNLTFASTAAGGGGGTVTSLSATNGTGQTWTVTNPTTTPNLSLALTADALTDGTTNKAYTATEKTKLAGVATGATNVTNNNQISNGSGYITPAGASTSTATTITYGATSTWNMSNGKYGFITLAGNTTLVVSNPTAYTYYEFEVTQDGTGGRTITWPSTFKWSSGTAPTLTATANAKDVITCSYNGSIFKCNFSPDYR